MRLGLVSLLVVCGGMALAKLPADLDENGVVEARDVSLFAGAWRLGESSPQWLAAAALAVPAAVLNRADAEHLLVAFLAQAPAPDHWVSTDGDDGGPGTREAPWRTIQHACDVAEPGDVVQVLPGTYAEDVVMTRSGEADRPIVFRGGGARIEPGGWQMASGASHLVLEGFRLAADDDRWVVSLEGGNSHITLHDLEVSGGDCGIHMTVGEHGQPELGPVEHVLVEGCRLTGANWTGLDVTPGPANHLTIRNCLVSENGRPQAGFGADGIAVEMGDHLVVEECVVEGNSSDGIDLCSRQGAPCESVVVRRCRVAGNHGDGVKLWWGGRLENTLITGHGLAPVVLIGDARYEIVNCTVAHNYREDKSYALVAAYPADPPSTGRAQVWMRNCLFAFNGPPEEPTGLYFGPQVQLDEDHNCFFSRDDGELQVSALGEEGEWVTREDIRQGRWTANGGGSHSFSADPQFAGAGDWRPAADGPCANAGTAEGAPATDLLGNPRPVGGAVDVGCYETG